MGITTVTGLSQRGYFLPYRYAERVAAAPDVPYAGLARAFAAALPEMRAVVGEICSLSAPLSAIGDAPPPAPRWTQGWFPRLDAAAAYAIVRRARPRRIVEVGSGHSTRFLARAVADAGLATTIVAIDPAPRAAIEGLDIEIRRTTLQEAGLETLGLGEGDLLFVDSSHILMPGSDVDILVNQVWPTLGAGTLVHFHDIFLPEDYPAAWRWRGYNEQLAVGALIGAGGAGIVFSSPFALESLAADLSETVLAQLPLFPGAIESSLWLRKRAPALRGANP